MSAHRGRVEPDYPKPEVLRVWLASEGVPRATIHNYVETVYYRDPDVNSNPDDNETCFFFMFRCSVTDELRVWGTRRDG